MEVRRLASAERRWRVAMEEICYVRGCKVVKRFVGGEENLEIDVLFYRKPMKLTEDESNVFSGGGVSKQSGSRVLYIWQFLKNSGGRPYRMLLQ
jgi:hypothetical protein